MTLEKLGRSDLTTRQMVEQAINSALPNIDDLPDREEFEITQAELEAELDAITTTESDIRPVVRGQPSAASVSESVAAMDAVAASETARDAVRDSDLAFDTVAGVNMAIGKFAAGGAGLDPTEYADMDAVAASETAMDAVAASETAMDAVSTSETAMDAVSASNLGIDAVTGSPAGVTGIFKSQYMVDYFWGNFDASDRTFSNLQIYDGSWSQVSSGETSSDGVEMRWGDDLVDTWGDPQGSGDNLPSGASISSALGLNDQSESAGPHLLGYEADLSDVDQIELWVRNTGDFGNHYATVNVDGDEVYAHFDDSDWSNETIGVSPYSGDRMVTFGYNQSDTERDNEDYWIGFAGIEFN